MKSVTGLLLVVACCVAVSSAAATKDQSKTLLNQFLRSTSNIENNDLDILNEELKLSDVKELLQRYEDASDLMNMDESERRRLGIHHNTYCHCHDNTCHCCRVVYIFWKIPIFKACIGIWYEVKDFVMKLQVYGITLVKHKLPLGEKKPVCGRVMGLYELCVELYNVRIHKGIVHVCMKITKPTKLDLKCFTLHAPRLQTDGDVDEEVTWTEVDNSALTWVDEESMESES